LGEKKSRASAQGGVGLYGKNNCEVGDAFFDELGGLWKWKKVSRLTGEKRLFYFGVHV